jgi:carbon monoxide dehydrogenase subunit G
MDLTHRFTVPLGVEETWGHFNDIASVAECFPGAQVTEFDGNSFSGSCKVKLGPIALVYNGSGSFVEKDDEAHRFVVDAKGKDKRGNGTAGAHVTLSMEETDGSTEVTVVTDLAITGKPAQFGRGVMQDVSDKLLGQFVACLEERFVAQPEPAPEEAADARTGADVQDGLAGGTPGAAAATGAAAAGASRAGFSSGTPGASGTSGGSGAGAGATHPAGAASSAARPAGAGTARPAGARKASSDDALDLGATVLPVLLKSYWKQVAGVLVVLLVLRRLLSRSRS